MLRFALFAGLWLGLLGQAAQAQSLPPDTTIPGFSIDGYRTVGVSDAYATLSNGDRVVDDGVHVDLVADDGSLIAHLATYPHFFFPSFVLPDPTESFALVGESDRGTISRVDLVAGGRVVLTDLDYNYDAAWEDPGHVLVSADPGGFGYPNEIWRLDVATGAQTLLAQVTGPSGPLALSTGGDLYYGLVPNGSGTASILRWTQSQIQSGSVLGVTDAAVFASGLAGASSMRFDHVYGHLFVATPTFGSPSDILEYAPGGQLVASVIHTPNWVSNLEFLYGPGPGSFQAFQPANGVTLEYRTTDYSAFVADIATVRPRRPRAATSGPGLSGPGDVFFTVTGAQTNASFLVLLGSAASYDPNESTYDLGSFLFETGMPIHHIRRLAYVATDASGSGTWSFYNPGNLQGTRVLQALIQDAGGTFIGSSTAAFN